MIVLLKVDLGKVKGMQIKSYQGKGYKKEVLEKAFQRITFTYPVKGTLELELLYM